MNLPRIYALLALWTVLLLTPALLMLAGLFGPIQSEIPISSTIILLWVGCYLAQFFLFLGIMAKVGEQRLLWKMAASLLPWAIDWTLPLSWKYALLWVPLLALINAWVVAVTQRKESLFKNGIRAVGTVLEVMKPWMNVIVNKVYIRRNLRLRIERENGGLPYEGIFKGLFMLGEIPSPGDKIRLRVDPNNPLRFEEERKSRP